MMRQHLPYYAIAAAILIVGLVALGVPIQATGPLLGIVLVCPLMIFMMRGMVRQGQLHTGGTTTLRRSRITTPGPDAEHPA